MLVFRAVIHKMLVRIANREDPDQTAFGRQLVYEILEHILYPHCMFLRENCTRKIACWLQALLLKTYSIGNHSAHSFLTSGMSAGLRNRSCTSR